MDTILQKVLETAPSIEGYTIRQLSDVINNPWRPIRGWHLERLEARGIKDPTMPLWIQKRVYKRKKKVRRK